MCETEKPTLVAQGEFSLGDIYIEGPSPSTSFAAIFEDDGENGCFYGLDLKKKENPVLLALHVYDNAYIEVNASPSIFQIIWSGNGTKAALFINGFPHAVIDFEGERGYCRSNIPEHVLAFSTTTHRWDDECLKWF